jgi:ATP-binding cassette, subfamily B, bacterial
VIRFLAGRIRGHRWLVVLAVTMTVLQVGADVLGALPIKWVLDVVVSHSPPEVGPLAAVLHWCERLPLVTVRAGVGAADSGPVLGVVAFSALMFVVFGALSTLLAYGQMRIATYVAQSLSADLRTTLFARIEALPLQWHARQRTGDLIQRVTGNIADIEKLVTDGLVDLLAGFLTLVGIVAVMLALSWRFTLVSVGVVPVLFVVVLRYTLAIKSATRHAARAAGRVTDVAAEDIRAITEIKVFTLEAHESRRFADRVAQLRRHAGRAGRLQAEFTPLVQLVIALATAVIVGVGGAVAAGYDVSLGFTRLPAGSLTVGTLAVFLSYLKQLYQPMRNLSKLTNMAATASSGAERIVEILDAEPEDLAGDGLQPFGRARGHIRFRDVQFGYRAGHPVLHGVNFDIRAGERVALVGLSGGGKTTIAKLVPRLHEVWAGTVSIDGRDVATIPLSQLRRNISFVPQESVLFEGTVRDNVAIGRADAPETAIRDACRRAHVHDAILALPDGYDTVVSEGGKNLSSGQRQRIAIARAILRDAPIIVLDEPTASLDVEAEAEVMHALDTLIRGRTVLMISHRLSTLGQVSRILVLSDGRIVERGTPAELAAAGGYFARLLAEQNRYGGLTGAVAESGDARPSEPARRRRPGRLRGAGAARRE